MGIEIPWTFKTWLENFVSVDLPIGDLAKDAAKDEDFPDYDDFDDIYEHLVNHRASREAREAFVLAWGYYLVSR